ncbi:hypothetical protein ABZ671_12965 [Micromonospora sp. NPDC006766]|uniref:hypothetical protein n=1 Tax=Micromonospora sp. NPDC006766 TaxID=3154778 RepID=UPI00340715DA
MKKKLGGYIAATALAAGGTLVATASPALAAGACDQTNSTVGACFDYASGTYARADFYMNRTVDSSYAHFRVWMKVNGGAWQLVKDNGNTVAGRNCCWNLAVAGNPQRWQTGQTKVTLYTSAWVEHTTSISPIVSFFA